LTVSDDGKMDGEVIRLREPGATDSPVPQL
jgi:hypothetical protein